jgi:hypothetical protein
MPSTESNSEKRERRAVEGKEAWREYEAEQRHINENMLRLRAERLARDAGDNIIQMTPKNKKKKA